MVTVLDAGPITPTRFFTGFWKRLQTFEVFTALGSNGISEARLCCSFSSDAAIASRMNSMLCSSAIGEYLRWSSGSGCERSARLMALEFKAEMQTGFRVK